jgi:DNA-binding Lrp family transcriptional regulator
MRCLLDNPMEISGIAGKISMSSKTVSRRLEKMIENHVLDFTVHFNPTTIRGYIMYVISANIENGSYRKVLERSSADLKDSFCVYSPLLSQLDMIHWFDVFVLDSEY